MHFLRFPEFDVDVRQKFRICQRDQICRNFDIWRAKMHPEHIKDGVDVHTF
jgi:hypothetical protein